MQSGQIKANSDSPLVELRLDLAAPGYSLTNALTCARLALAAYDEATIEDTVTDTQVLIRDLGSAVVIAFRGTLGMHDWLTDAKFQRSRVETMAAEEVHAGFLEAFNAVWLKITSVLLSLDAKPIFVTGHSLGGALAILCAWRLAQRDSFARTIHSVYTFGQPRVGNAAFRNHYDTLTLPETFITLRDRTFRFINAEDIVPRVPGWLMGYRHCGLPLLFSSWFGFRQAPSLLLMALSDLLGTWEAWTIEKRISLLTDHSMTRYIEQLEALQ